MAVAMDRVFQGKRAAFVVISILVLISVTFGVRFARQQRDVWVADLGSLNEKGVIYDPVLKVFVVANGREPVALSAIDPHLGHRDLYCSTSQTFDGRHGEKFDRLGRYIGGPAPRGMDRLGVRLRGTGIYVDIGDRIEGPPRGAPHGKAEGPFCPEEGLEGPPGFLHVTQ